MSSSQEREAALLAPALGKPAAEGGLWLEAVCEEYTNLRRWLENLPAAGKSNEEVPP